MIKIDVIIPTKDNVEKLVSCVSSINKAVTDNKKLKVNVLIIDNKSSKSSRKDFLAKILKYDIFKNINISATFIGRQQEYVKLINIGIDIANKKRVKSNFLAVINDNVNIEETWFDTLLNEFNLNEKLIGVSSSLKENNQKINFEACIFKLNEMKKLDENLILSVNIGNIFSKKYSDKQLLVTSKSVLDYEVNVNNSSIEAVNLNSSIKDSFSKKAYVLYTYIGEKDSVPKLNTFDSKFEYVCFSTKNNFGINVNWKIIDISKIKEAMKFDDFQMKEYIKLHPHFFFENKSSSIWIDFSKIDDILTEDLTDLVFKMKKTNFLLIPESSTCDCPYKMLLSYLNKKRISNKTFEEILQLFRWYNLKSECGMVDSSIIISNHNNEKCINVMNKIWNYVYKMNVNDDLFINFILFINRYNYSYVPSTLFYKKYFKLKENAK